MEITDNTPTGEELLKQQHEKDRQERKRISDLMKEAHKDRLKAVESEIKPNPILGYKTQKEILKRTQPPKPYPAIMGLPGEQ